MFANLLSLPTCYTFNLETLNFMTKKIISYVCNEGILRLYLQRFLRLWRETLLRNVLTENLEATLTTRRTKGYH